MANQAKVSRIPLQAQVKRSRIFQENEDARCLYKVLLFRNKGPIWENSIHQGDEWWQGDNRYWFHSMSSSFNDHPISWIMMPRRMWTAQWIGKATQLITSRRLLTIGARRYRGIGEAFTPEQRIRLATKHWSRFGTYSWTCPEDLCQISRFFNVVFSRANVANSIEVVTDTASCVDGRAGSWETRYVLVMEMVWVRFGTRCGMDSLSPATMSYLCSTSIPRVPPSAELEISPWAFLWIETAVQ